MSALAPTIGLLLGSAFLIYLACEYFVNGIEWVGRRFDISQKATGTVLAAAGTALPESVVTFVAVVFGTTSAAKEIGVGAAVGGPLVLSTLAYAVVGVALLATRRALATDAAGVKQLKHLARDQRWFLLIFTAALLLGLKVFPFKPWLGLAFLGAYAVYVWNEMRAGSTETEGELEPLKIAPGLAQPTAKLALLQTFAALAVIFVASRLFVQQIQILGPHLGLKPQLLALLLSPIATEAPEIINAIIWVREGKIKLAMANISGAMMIQATVPTALGVFFTSWVFDPALVAAGVTTLVAVAVLWLLFRRGRMGRWMLASVGLLYAAFIVAVVLMRW